MDENTDSKYLKLSKLTSELDQLNTLMTRQDPSEDTWDEIKSMLEIHPGLEARTILF